MTATQLRVLRAVNDAGPDGFQPYDGEWRTIKSLVRRGLVAKGEGWPLVYRMTRAGWAELAK